jgi:hypothetical protein
MKTIAFACALALLVSPASAQTVADFYRGKQIKLVVGTAPGQDYDLWARLIGRHITRHIPGNPSLIVENMPGAGHIVATNHLFNVAARDGTVLGMVSRNMTDAAVMGLANVRYDPVSSQLAGQPRDQSSRDVRVDHVGLTRSPPRAGCGRAGRCAGMPAAPPSEKPARHELKIVQGYRSPGAGARGDTRRGWRLRHSVGGPGWRAPAMGRDRADAHPV